MADILFGKCPLCDNSIKVVATNQIHRLECEDDKCGFALEVNCNSPYHVPGVLRQLLVSIPKDWFEGAWI